MIEAGNKKAIAIEVKRSISPSLRKGFLSGFEDVGATHRYFVYSGAIIFSLPDRNEVYELSLEKEQELCLKHGIEYINFPITNRNVPK